MKNSSSKAFGKGFLHILLRIIAHALMFLPIFYVNFIGKISFISRKLQLPFAFLIALIIYVLICLPSKNFYYSFLYSNAKGENDLGLNFSKRFSLSIKILLKKLPYSLPLLALSGYAYYILNIAPFSRLGSLLTSIGGLFGGSIRYGALAILGLFIIAAALFILGAYRFTGMHFLANNSLDYAKLKIANKATLTLNRAAIAKARLMNIALALPAFLLVMLCLYIELSPSLTGDIKLNLILINKKLNSFSFSSQTNMSLLFTLVFAYIPLRILRKIRLARAFAADYDKA